MMLEIIIKRYLKIVHIFSSAMWQLPREILRVINFLTVICILLPQGQYVLDPRCFSKFLGPIQIGKIRIFDCVVSWSPSRWFLHVLKIETHTLKKIVCVCVFVWCWVHTWIQAPLATPSASSGPWFPAWDPRN